MTNTNLIGPADDSAIVAELLRLRDAGAPRWLRLYVNNDTSTILIRLPLRADLAAWREKLGSAVMPVVEPHPASGLDYHSCDFRDWQPHWTVIMSVRVDYPATPLPASSGDALADAVSPSPSFRVKRAAHRAKAATVKRELSTPDIRPAVSL